jgi:hypothetical protein
MKKNLLTIKTGLLLLFISSFISCSSDDSGESTGTTTGDYWPMKINNSWTFENNGNTEEIKFIGTNEFNGKTYYKLQDFNSPMNAETWIRKNGATYYERVGDVNSTENGISITIKSHEVPIFKDDLEVNQTWSGTIRPKVTYSYNGTSGSLPTKVTYVGKIIAKNATETINGVTYTNIIKMTLNADTDVDGQQNSTYSEYWFAKDIGPIKQYGDVDGNVISNRLLASYTLN